MARGTTSPEIPELTEFYRIDNKPDMRARHLQLLWPGAPEAQRPGRAE